jgi:hypothetical protein
MNTHKHPKANAELLPQERPFVSEIPKLRKLIAAQGLIGLANDTKWNELLTEMRGIPDEKWCPSFRFRCVDSEFISQWDGEWWHHLPFPFISVLWIELSYHEEIHRGRLLAPEVIDHSAEVSSLLESIGLDYEKGTNAFRVFGYAPRDRKGFEPNTEAEQDPGSNVVNSVRSG